MPSLSSLDWARPAGSAVPSMTGLWAVLCDLMWLFSARTAGGAEPNVMRVVLAGLQTTLCPLSDGLWMVLFLA